MALSPSLEYFPYGTIRAFCQNFQVNGHRFKHYFGGTYHTGSSNLQTSPSIINPICGFLSYLLAWGKECPPYKNEILSRDRGLLNIRSMSQVVGYEHYIEPTDSRFARDCKVLNAHIRYHLKELRYCAQCLIIENEDFVKRSRIGHSYGVKAAAAPTHSAFIRAASSGSKLTYSDQQNQDMIYEDFDQVDQLEMEGRTKDELQQ
ncbi:hypothetical protein Tco_0466378 [Tanacetum coccineum]